MEVQSVAFNKTDWTPFRARVWLDQNGYKSKKISLTDDAISFRQQAPSMYKAFAVKTLPGGIDLVLGKKR